MVGPNVLPIDIKSLLGGWVDCPISRGISEEQKFHILKGSYANDGQPLLSTVCVLCDTYHWIFTTLISGQLPCLFWRSRIQNWTLWPRATIIESGFEPRQSALKLYILYDMYLEAPIILEKKISNLFFRKSLWGKLIDSVIWHIFCRERRLELSVELVLHHENTA